LPQLTSQPTAALQVTSQVAEPVQSTWQLGVVQSKVQLPAQPKSQAGAVQATLQVVPCAHVPSHDVAALQV
jgi:hypothetical protein